MATLRPVAAALCAALVLLCLAPHSSGFALSRMVRQSGPERCVVRSVCAFYNVHLQEKIDTCICPSETSCELIYKNLATGVWKYRCLGTVSR